MTGMSGMVSLAHEIMGWFVCGCLQSRREIRTVAIFGISALVTQARANRFRSLSCGGQRYRAIEGMFQE
jgi:hypothetical protein